MTVLGAILLMIGVICLVALLCALWVKIDKKRIEKKRESEKGYDERQQIAQGRASNFALAVSAIYYGAVSLYLMGSRNGEYPVDPLILVVDGLMLVVLSYNLYCLMTDAILPLKGRPTGILMFIGGTIGLIAIVISSFNEEMPLTGKGSDRWYQLFYFVGYVAIAVIYWIAYFREKRDAKRA